MREALCHPLRSSRGGQGRRLAVELAGDRSFRRRLLPPARLRRRRLLGAHGTGHGRRCRCGGGHRPASTDRLGRSAGALRDRRDDRALTGDAKSSHSRTSRGGIRPHRRRLLSRHTPLPGATRARERDVPRDLRGPETGAGLRARLAGGARIPPVAATAHCLARSDHGRHGPHQGIPPPFGSGQRCCSRTPST